MKSYISSNLSSFFRYCIHTYSSSHDSIHFFLQKLTCRLSCILLRLMHSYFSFIIFDSIITKIIIHILFLFTIFWAAWVCHFAFQIETVQEHSWKHRLFVTSFNWMNMKDFVWYWLLFQRSFNILDQSWCF